MPGWYPHAAFKPKPCVVCAEMFTPKSGANKFCSTHCRGRWKYVTGAETTETQYEKISGNWRRYYARLAARATRGTLSTEELLRVHELQSGLCALSGRPLTCILKKGTRVWTNASIDRVTPGGPYELSNIQLVSSALNGFRAALPVADFIEWCCAVAAHNRSA